MSAAKNPTKEEKEIAERITNLVAARIDVISNTAVQQINVVSESSIAKVSSIADSVKEQITNAALFEGVLNSLPLGVYVIDPDLRILFYNLGIVRLLGPQKKGEKIDVTSSNYGFYLADQHTPWPTAQLPFARVSRDNTPNGGIMFVRNEYKPEGIWITNFAYPLRNTKGELIGAVAVLKEIELASERGLPHTEPNVPPLPLGM
jgi:PAS domain-containing protein